MSNPVSDLLTLYYFRKKITYKNIAFSSSFLKSYFKSAALNKAALSLMCLQVHKSRHSKTTYIWKRKIINLII